MAVLAIVAIHTIEACCWAALYYRLGEFVDFERALYFSVVTATTLGFGDVTLSARWQLLSTFEVMGGLLLFGTSTAFLLEALRHLFKLSAKDD
jgi:voltage-gated potassium channel Kch